MRKRWIITILSVLMLILAACGTSNNNDGNNENNNSNEEVNDTNNNENENDNSNENGNSGNNGDNASEDTVMVEHELGETEVQKNPETVVVFDFGALDTLDKLGIDVAGVAQNNMPSYLDKYESDEYENIGSLKEPDFEKIANIDPDLIIISGRQASMYDELSKLGDTIHLGVDNDRYMDSFKENLAIIGEIFDKEDEVESELADIESSIDELNEKAEDIDGGALIILSNDDKISAYGPNSRFGIIHDVFGIPAIDEDIEASTHGMNVSFEYVKEENPSILYVIDRSAAIGEESGAEQIVENKLVEDTDAYKDDKIVYLDPEFWYLSGGGLVSVTEMIDEITQSLD